MQLTDRDAQLHGYLDVQARLGRWNPSDLAFIESVFFEAASEYEVSRLRVSSLWQRRDLLREWPSACGDWYRVELEFIGVMNLRFQVIGSAPLQVMGFEMVDVSDRGLEGAAVEVGDYESDRVAFQASSGRVASVEVCGAPWWFV